MSKAPGTAKEKATIVEEVKGVYALFSDGRVRLDNIRFSHPHVVTAQKQTNDDGLETESYNCVAIMDKTTHGPAQQVLTRINKKLEASKPPGKDGKPFKVSADKKYIKNGDALDEDGDRKYAPEYAGAWFVSAREKTPPALRGADIDPKTGKVRRLTPGEANKKFYGGAYGSMMIRPWVFGPHPKYGKRLSCNLIALQFLRDGEPFGEGRVSEEEVDDGFEGAEPDTGGWDDDDDDM